MLGIERQSGITDQNFALQCYRARNATTSAKYSIDPRALVAGEHKFCTAFKSYRICVIFSPIEVTRIHKAQIISANRQGGGFVSAGGIGLCDAHGLLECWIAVGVFDIGAHFDVG